MPVVTIRCRPKSDGQRQRVAGQIIEAVAAEFDLPADRVQVFFDEYDDTHWYRGVAADRSDGTAPVLDRRPQPRPDATERSSTGQDARSRTAPPARK